jgi:tRNA(Ile)-lysidine synthase
MNQNFIDFMKEFDGRRVAAAVSGGVDSITMLHWIAELGLDAVALTVDHGLRSKSAEEAAFVERVAASLGIPHATLKWTGAKPDAGIEEAAREARYNLMLDFCRNHGIGVLVLAHQADDQIETFLMNLGRGSGVYGLAAIRSRIVRDGIVIARPLLSTSRKELEEYCRARGIEHVRDEMNEDDGFLRVRIRKNRHLLRDKLGISDARIMAAITALGRARDALERQVGELLDRVMPRSADGLMPDRAVFSASFLFDMDAEIQLKFLSRLVQAIGGGAHPARLEKIQLALRKLERDTMLTLGGCIMRRLGAKILVAREGASTSFKPQLKTAPKTKTVEK